MRDACGESAKRRVPLEDPTVTDATVCAGESIGTPPVRLGRSDPPLRLGRPRENQARRRRVANARALRPSRPAAVGSGMVDMVRLSIRSPALLCPSSMYIVPALESQVNVS